MLQSVTVTLIYGQWATWLAHITSQTPKIWLRPLAKWNNKSRSNPLASDYPSTRITTVRLSNARPHDPLRLRSVLDFIANFCVSRPRGGSLCPSNSKTFRRPMHSGWCAAHIDVFKLSRRGCQTFLWTMNAIYGTSSFTQGCHEWWYNISSLTLQWFSAPHSVTLNVDCELFFCCWVPVIAKECLAQTAFSSCGRYIVGGFHSRWIHGPRWTLPRSRSMLRAESSSFTTGISVNASLSGQHNQRAYHQFPEISTKITKLLSSWEFVHVVGLKGHTHVQWQQWRTVHACTSLFQH